MPEKIIGHLDLDAFFASVEEVAKPHLKGKPIAVGADPQDGFGRGVISTANYKAREYGLHSAMPVSKAWQLSEEARKQGKEPVVFLLGSYELYGKVSKNVREIIAAYSEKIEQASVDEFYFDLSGAGSFKKAEQICKKIKKEILTKEGITCSVGLAPNTYIAKIAAGFRKPDGLFIVRQEAVQDFLDPLGIREIPGIGPKTADIFYKEGIQTIKQLRGLSEERLRELVGKQGAGIYQMVRGIGNTEINEERIVKSIGEQTTFNTDTLDAAYIFDQLKMLSGSVFESFSKSEFTAFKTITATVRFSDFITKTSSRTLPKPLTKQDKKSFEFEAIKLLLPFLDKRQNPKRKLIRLIGVRAERFS